MAARLRLYAAVSLDGCIADARGEVGWLHPFEAQDYGLAGFLAGIGTVLSGRATYDQARGFGDWPYAGKRVVVLTRRPLEPNPPAGVEAMQGEIGSIVTRLRAEGTRDIWLLGGAAVARACLALDLVDTLELFLVPVTLGAGLRLFGADGPPRGWALETVQHFPNGVVAMVHRRA